MKNNIHVPITAEDKTGRAFRSAKQNIAQFSKSALGAKLALAAVAAATIRYTKTVIDYASKLTDAAIATNTNVEACKPSTMPRLRPARRNKI